MNYSELLNHQKQLILQVLAKLQGDLPEFYGAVDIIKQLMHKNPIMWSALGQDSDTIELLRLSVKPETFMRICSAAKEFKDRWTLLKSRYIFNQDEVFNYVMYLMDDTLSEERTLYVLGRIIGFIMETEYQNPRPIQTLIQGTIFEAIYQNDLVAFRNHLEYVSINSTIEPLDDTCLIFAIRYKCLKAIAWILEKPACQIHRMNRRGETALDLARKLHLDEIVTTLVTRGDF